MDSNRRGMKHRVAAQLTAARGWPWRTCVAAAAAMGGSAAAWAALLPLPARSTDPLAQSWVPGPVAHTILSAMAVVLALIIVVMMVYAARHGLLTLNRLLADLGGDPRHFPRLQRRFVEGAQAAVKLGAGGRAGRQIEV